VPTVAAWSTKRSSINTVERRRPICCGDRISSESAFVIARRKDIHGVAAGQKQ
jgi:hypothetical protein